ncbi:DivIVA domain-containing protein [Dietzia sp. PP-33]|jgi:DivIVA domain-containing protein|uniref:DivIVA domain-containing protein n=1 Tax=Dietzia sp. PP-33 TaxID=2957500 RepID=UPI0029BE9E2C|nr:DivIVA domain-containing protein [Dietzia sp. PP-33]MDX2355775.1 DivIVA domain-containing protein [Dietzia sp. PP-33]
MLTVVVYVAVTLIVAAALFALSIVVFGRSELLPPVARGHTVTTLPAGPFTGDDLRSVRFGMSARGYTMAEVDWALEQAAAEIDRLRTRLGEEADTGTPSHGVGPERAPASRPGATR